MRDPNRIDKYCKKLAHVWRKVPDWRLTQLFVNAISAYEAEHDTTPFYLEDEEFLKFLSDYINSILPLV